MKEPDYSLYLDSGYRPLLNYSRIVVLSVLYNERPDGVPYKVLKEIVRLPDGSFGPNISWLKDRNYIISKEQKFEGENTVTYIITEAGENAYLYIKKWLEKVIEIRSGG